MVNDGREVKTFGRVNKPFSHHFVFLFKRRLKKMSNATCITTALDIIKRALRLLCVKATGEEISAMEGQDALKVLNQMLAQWSNERLMVYQIINELWPVVAGQTDYTVGPSPDADWQTTRPLMMQNASAFVRAMNPTTGINVDYRMDYFPNDRFQMLLQKNIQSTYPYIWTNDHANPISTIRLYPKPTIALSFGLSQSAQFEKLNALSDVISMPPGYESCLGYNLAVELSAEYGITPDALQVIVLKASETKDVLKRSNTEPTLVGVDRELLGRGGIYNIFGDF
jgi:hypothetical protein